LSGFIDTHLGLMRIKYFLNKDFLGLLVCCSGHRIEMIYAEKKITISSIFGSKMSYDYCGLPELLLLFIL